MLILQRTVFVLVDGQRVDDAHCVALAEPLKLADDLAVEVGVAEPQDDELYRSDSHKQTPFLIRTPALAVAATVNPQPPAKRGWPDLPTYKQLSASRCCPCKPRAAPRRPGR
jgi:hypothetical protein